MFFKTTENVFVQDSVVEPPGSAVWIPSTAQSSSPPALSHVVQFYRGGPVEMTVQALAAQSMRLAQVRAEHPVRLVAAPIAGEMDTVPAGFTATQALSRTIRDVKRFLKPRPLPLLFDILDTAGRSADPGGFLIFTNSDICLTPPFYNSVRSLLSAGFDGLIINRRTVGELSSYGASPELAAMDAGSPHPGADCFVFPVSWIGSFVKSEACVGMNMVMRSLVYNLVARAERMLIMKDTHLTYHYGNDETWKSSAFDDYTQHNLNSAGTIVQTLCRDRVPYRRIRSFCIAHREPFVPYAEMHETGVK